MFTTKNTPGSVSVALSGLLLSLSCFAGSLNFPSTPLTSKTEPPPNVLLALSVEFPTVGAAYNGANQGLNNGEDQRFAPTNLYLGYFDPNKCYRYSVSTPTTANNGYFFPTGKVIDQTSRYCNNIGSTGASNSRWSGNFLNWALTSAIDTLRKNLSGGYRFQDANLDGDTSAFTVLARARLDANILGGRNSYFPTRRVGTGTLISNTATDSRLVAAYQSPGKKEPNTQQITVRAEDNYVTVTEYGADGVTPVGSALQLNPRVQVCNSNVSGLTVTEALESNCAQYGANYKPEGNVQKFSASMRFAALGYVIENNNSRQGGVLRAAIKSTGALKWQNGGYVNNTAAEWSTATGVFATNPDAASEGNSGVVNYLNKFGLVSGYKTNDPVSELFSESVRYLMNKQPVPAYVSGVTTAMTDAFPVASSWQDPVLGACQKQHIIVIGDTNTWCDGSVPGGAEIDTGTCGATASVPADFNATAWTNAIGSREGFANMSGSQAGAPGGTYLIAGTAYFANTQNLRPDLSTTQKMTARTYTIDVGEPGRAIPTRQYWYAAKYGGFIDSNNNGVPDAGEWEATPGDPNSYPKTFFLASDPVRMNAGLNEIFNTISSSVGGTGSAATTSQRIGSSTGVFSLSTDANSWSGDLQKFPISVTGSSGVTTLNIGTTPAWSASKSLTGTTLPSVVAPNPLPAVRNIWTFISGAPSSDFTATNSVAKAFFDVNPLSSPLASDGFGAQRVNWLRGVRTDEGSATVNLNVRTSLLGDAGRSGAVYVGPPSSSISDPSYGTYVRNNISRIGVVFVGSSSGMLHGFRETDGVEVFAYLPSVLWSKARALTAKGAARTPMVDAVPVVGDVALTSATDWHTVLVGGLGSGAQGIFAIDATSPSNIRPLWEFTPSSAGITASDASDLGNVTGIPTIAKLPTGDWVAIIGNGYNSTNGRSAIFVVKLNNSTGSWSKDVNYWKYGGTNVPAIPATAAANGMGPVAVASANQLGIVEYLYAGDLLGNVFRIDLSSVITSMPSSWETATTNKPFLLFAAGLPITTVPQVAFHPYGGFEVLLGTGKLLEQSDRATPFADQAVFGLWDKNRTTAITNSTTGSPAPLAARTLITTGQTRTISGAPLDYGAGQAGWKLALSSGGGERIIADPDLEFGKFSLISVSVGAVTCADGGSWLYNLDPITGLALPAASFDVNGDGRINAADGVVAGIALGASSFGSPTNIRIPPSASTPIGQALYFTLLPTSANASAPNTPNVTGTLARAVGPSGRINFRQITR